MRFHEHAVIHVDDDVTDTSHKALLRNVEALKELLKGATVPYYVDIVIPDGEELYVYFSHGAIGRDTSVSTLTAAVYNIRLSYSAAPWRVIEVWPITTVESEKKQGISIVRATRVRLVMRDTAFLEDFF